MVTAVNLITIIYMNFKTVMDLERMRNIFFKIFAKKILAIT